MIPLQNSHIFFIIYLLVFFELNDGEFIGMKKKIVLLSLFTFLNKTTCKDKIHIMSSSTRSVPIPKTIKKWKEKWNWLQSEAFVQRCSVKKVFLEISQNSQENTSGLGPATLLKKRLWHRCFPVNFVKFLRTPFFTEHLGWLLLYSFQRKKRCSVLSARNIKKN